MVGEPLITPGFIGATLNTPPVRATVWAGGTAHCGLDIFDKHSRLVELRPQCIYLGLHKRDAVLVAGVSSAVYLGPERIYLGLSRRCATLECDTFVKLRHVAPRSSNFGGFISLTPSLAPLRFRSLLRR
jgi:hypothetical protein